jgi:hypothetical protein
MMETFIQWQNRKPINDARTVALAVMDLVTFPDLLRQFDLYGIFEFAKLIG